MFMKKKILHQEYIGDHEYNKENLIKISLKCLVCSGNYKIRY